MDRAVDQCLDWFLEQLLRGREHRARVFDGFLDALEATMSQNSTLTCLRSPSIAPRTARICSVMCGVCLHRGHHMATPPSRPAPATCTVPHSPVRSHGHRIFSPRIQKRQEPIGTAPRDPTRIARDFHPGERLIGDFRPCRRQRPNEPRPPQAAAHYLFRVRPWLLFALSGIPLRDTVMAQPKCIPQPTRG
jgi:hypothetical protein